MADKAKHAFGSSANIDAALQAGTIDAYDILFLDGDSEPKIGWIDKNGNKVIVGSANEQIVVVDALPESGKEGIIYICAKTLYIWDGSGFMAVSESTDLSVLLEQISSLETEVANKVDAEDVESKIEVALDKCLYEKYEITHKPEGTLVDYRDKEIRVMCPADTKWVKQNVGATGNANMYYMGFKAYAPEGAVSFKEDDLATIEDQTMYYFENNQFAGVDELGRKYSIVWLALASYDEASDTWTYFGEKSTAEKYIGWYYSVEWYDANGVVIASDRIRINLSNEDCHSSIEPYYMNDVIEAAHAYTDTQIEAKIAEISVIDVVEF